MYFIFNIHTQYIKYTHKINIHTHTHIHEINMNMHTHTHTPNSLI